MTRFLSQGIYFCHKVFPTFTRAIAHDAGFCISAGCCDLSPQRGLCVPDSSKGTGLQIPGVVHSPPHSGGKPQGHHLSFCAVLTKQKLTRSAGCFAQPGFNMHKKHYFFAVLMGFKPKN